MPSFNNNFLGFVWLSLHVFYDLSFLEELKLNIFMINYRKMLLLQKPIFMSSLYCPLHAQIIS